MVAPRTVEVQARARSSKGPKRGHVEVASVRSMISNGTELKFWRGDFGDDDDDQGLDATIEVRCREDSPPSHESKATASKRREIHF
jgi:hypothetical protein